MEIDRLPLVVIPTVSQRREVCAEVVAAWEAQGFDVITQLTPDAVPHNPRQQGITSVQVLRRGMALRPDEPLLFAEDDIWIRPEVAAWVRNHLPLLGPVTFYTDGLTYYPAHLKRQVKAGTPHVGAITTFGIVNRRVWFGSLALLLPRSLIEQVITDYGDSGEPFDRMLNSYVNVQHIAVTATYPNLVQHRRVRSVAGNYHARNRSRSYPLFTPEDNT